MCVCVGGRARAGGGGSGGSRAGSLVEELLHTVTAAAAGGLRPAEPTVVLRYAWQAGLLGERASVRVCERVGGARDQERARDGLRALSPSARAEGGEG